MLVFSLLAILLLDIVVGTVVHAAGFDPMGSGMESAYRTPHKLYHHGLRPSVAATGYWGGINYKVTTDSLGFKSAEVRETPLRSDRSRLLVIGDSFTEGSGMEYPDTYVAMLGKQLGAGTEVLNAGVVSYSPIVYNQKVRHLINTVGLQVNHVLVMIDMSDIEDEAKYYWQDEAGHIVRSSDLGAEESLKHFINRNTILVKAIRTTLRRIKHSRKRQQGAGSATNRWRCLWGNEDKAWQEYGEKGLKLATKHMDLLRQFLKEKKLPMTVGVYPWPDQVARKDLEAKQVTHWRAWCQRNNVAFVNCFPAFVTDEDPTTVIEKCFIPGDVHWNRHGHERIANRLADHFRKVAPFQPQKR